MRSSNLTVIAISSSMEMVYLLEAGVSACKVSAAVCTWGVSTMGAFLMVPLTIVSLILMFTLVLGGKGSGLGSVRLQNRPHVSPPSY